jgi:hypothetical protein
MSDTTKTMSQRDADQTLKSAFNDIDCSYTNSGFLTAKLGRKIEIGGASNVETYTFIENGVTLYVLTLTYSSPTKETLVSAERTT